MRIITLTNETILSIKIKGEFRIFRIKNSELDIKMNEIKKTISEVR